MSIIKQREVSSLYLLMHNRTRFIVTKTAIMGRSLDNQFVTNQTERLVNSLEYEEKQINRIYKSMSHNCKLDQYTVHTKKKYGQYGDRTRDIRVISTTL